MLVFHFIKEISCSLCNLLNGLSRWIECMANPQVWPARVYAKVAFAQEWFKCEVPSMRLRDDASRVNGPLQVTADDEIKFGISLKNIGPAFSFSGTGLSFTTVNESGNPMTVEFRSYEMELPTCLNIGASYDFLFEKWDQRLTVAANFTSNAFSRDNFGLGFEYSMLKRFMVRAAYVYQRGLWDSSERATAIAGLCAGASVEFPFGKEGNTALSLDYSYRSSYNMRGSHSIGATFKF